MKKVTKIINVHLFMKDGKKCFFHIAKCDKTRCKMPCANGTSECWITGWNPMPVSGVFMSSLGVFQKWMEDNGWSYYTHPVTTIIEKE